MTSNKRRTFIKSLLGAVVALVLALCMRAAERSDTVYFLSGTPSTLRSLNVGSTLYRFSSVDNSLTVVRQVVDHERGSAFIETDYDRRMIVAGSPPLQVTSLSVIDMDAPEVVRTLQ